eukprot:CAMPEP_0172454368 /NCGR_PEP_ID=MMETSP1065-20121228/11378_1 /TAXON_ID=265537 /ORGANISM="Amphiprora paludosa, Strain CCMP125" /LENGTH=663 /DNA_ID=CAMNT_0013206687 /DNA_START=167 /DNA_END=2158 /DNA_ORIENTATION=+
MSTGDDSHGGSSTESSRNSSQHEQQQQDQQQQLMESFVKDLCFWDQSTREIQQPPKSVRQAPKSPTERSAVILEAKDLRWQSAVDPDTGKTYYYDTKTHETRWKKPSEIRRWEKQVKRERVRQRKAFFREMEQNILASLERRELIPGVPSLVSTHYYQSQVPLYPPHSEPEGVTSAVASNCRIRTISGMDENVLANMEYVTKSHSATATMRRNGSSTSLQRATAAAGTASSASSVGSSKVPTKGEGRPPLPSQHVRRPSQQQLHLLQQQQQQQPPQPGTPSAASRLSMEDGFVAVASPASQASTKPPACRPSSRKEEQSVIPNHEESDETRSTQSDPRGNCRMHHGKSQSHSGNPYSSSATLTNPDVAATIQSVCGVYRTHIVQGVERQKLQQHPNRPRRSFHPMEPLLVCLFKDDYNDALPPRARNTMDVPLAIPSIQEIITFYNEYYLASKMQEDTIIMSLIYLERLIKYTNGTLVPTPENWRSLLFSCMILASKVWDDFSMWNVDFSDVSLSMGHKMGLPFSLARINELEVAVLTNLKFNVRVSGSEYAKYYFSIRTMMMRGGLTQPEQVSSRRPKATTTAPIAIPSPTILTRDEKHTIGGHLLDDETHKLSSSWGAESTLSNKAAREQRSFSADWNLFSSVLQSIEVPSLSSLVARTSQ